MGKIIYWVLLVLGVLIIFGGIMELFSGRYQNVAGGLIIGIIFLLIANKIKKKLTNK